MALREINIADPSVIQRQFLTRHITFWSVCLLGILCLISAYYLYQTRIVLSHKNPVTNLTEMQNHIAARIEKINQLKGELQKLQARQGTIEAIAKGKPFAAIISRLAESMNDETWLSRLDIKNVKGEDTKIELTLDGFTFSNAKMGDFLNNLNHVSFFKDVTLKYANEVGGDVATPKGGHLSKSIQFQIVCTVSDK
jgi:Tfp pilus assembly protein PilN